MAGESAILTRRHWIFDLDGTLTQPLHDFAAIRGKLGVPANRGILEFIDAQSAPERDSLNQRLTEIERDVAERAEPNPGAVELLHALAQRQMRLGIFTRNRRECVEITLKRLGVCALFPATTIVACEDGEPKPHPQGVARLLAGWSSAPEDALIVGDFRYDLEAGRAAGIATVLLDSSAERRWPALTDLQVVSLDQLHCCWLDAISP
nr:HAD family hydrolase [Motiliproteus sediminis]